MVGSACDVAKKSEKLCLDPDKTQAAARDNGESSFVGCAQVFSENSQTFHSSPAVLLNCLYLTVLNFSEYQRWKPIDRSVTVLTSFPVSFQRKPDTCESSTQETKVSKSLKKDLRSKGSHMY